MDRSDRSGSERIGEDQRVSEGIGEDRRVIVSSDATLSDSSDTL